MVDRINKTLRKMSSKERAHVLDILEQLKRGQMIKLDVKKLRGVQDTYRIRMGSFRIIFYMPHREDIRIIDIERRSDTTYREF